MRQDSFSIAGKPTSAVVLPLLSLPGSSVSQIILGDSEFWLGENGYDIDFC